MKKIILSFLPLFFILFHISAEKTPFNNLYSYKLSNGLTLFVAENHAVPLTYVEIAVKCGAFTQDKNTAGLFHLYEHMMFKGNSLYKDAASVNRALSDMGVSNWNGSTGAECVNYYVEAPSGQTEKAIEFWNAAIRFPLLDKKELENEKSVVLSEITGNYSDQGRIFNAAASRILFPEHPYRLDPGGSDTVVKNATVKQLKDIQKKFYIPNNSAVFVGGDVNPEEVYSLVQKYFGDWKAAPDPFSKGAVQENVNPYSEIKKYVMQFDKISLQFAQIYVNWRGPDAYFDREDTYSADVINFLISDPSGAFVQKIMNEGYIGVPDSCYTGGSYLTKSRSGVLDFIAGVTSPEEELPDRALYFADFLQEAVKAAVQVEQPQIDEVVQRLEDSDIYAHETAKGLLQNARFWWITSDEEYFYTYNKKMKEVTPENLESFRNKYLLERNPVIFVLINPVIYEKTKEQFAEKGFTEITSDNAFWFKK